MPRMSWVFCGLSSLFLATCDMQSPAPTEQQAGLTTTCPAETLQALVGTTYRDDQVTYSGRVRVITPLSAVTMDFIASRLNVHVDDAGVIQKLTCG